MHIILDAVAIKFSNAKMKIISILYVDRSINQRKPFTEEKLALLRALKCRYKVGSWGFIILCYFLKSSVIKSSKSVQ